MSSWFFITSCMKSGVLYGSLAGPKRSIACRECRVRFAHVYNPQFFTFIFVPVSRKNDPRLKVVSHNCHAVPSFHALVIILMVCESPTFVRYCKKCNSPSCNDNVNSWNRQRASIFGIKSSGKGRRSSVTWRLTLCPVNRSLHVSAITKMTDSSVDQSWRGFLTLSAIFRGQFIVFVCERLRSHWLWA